MRFPNTAKPSLFLAGCIALAAAASALIGAAPAPSGKVIELPRKDRAEIEKYLGRGVVGKAVEAKPIDDPGSFMGLGEKTTLRVKYVYGDLKGKVRDVTITQLDRADSRPAWRLESGDDIWYGEVEEDGDFVQYSTADKDHGVITRYSPPEPILYKGMEPGTSRTFKIDVSVYDLAHQDEKEHSGYLDVTYAYIGAYEVTVPAGTFEAILCKWEYTGKVGPAKIEDDQYFFIVEGVGPVARIHKKDISAFLVYSDKAKSAVVLMSRE